MLNKIHELRIYSTLYKLYKKSDTIWISHKKEKETKKKSTMWMKCGLNVAIASDFEYDKNAKRAIMHLHWLRGRVGVA